MFCRYCGKKIFDDSIFCSFCGKQLADRKVEIKIGEEEASPGLPFESDPEFIWDLPEPPVREEPEEIRFIWEAAPAPEIPAEFEIPAEPVITEEPGQNEQIDKFYTFNKKNEEFQKLLDKEYEKVKGSEFVNEEEEPEEDPVLESFIFDNDTLSKRFDTKEFNKDLIESALEKAGVVIKKDHDYGAGPEKDSYESEFKPRFILDTGAADETPEAPLSENTVETPAAADTADTSGPAVITETDEAAVPEASILPVVDLKKQEAFKALEELWDANIDDKPESDASADAAPWPEIKPDWEADQIGPQPAAAHVTREEAFSDSPGADGTENKKRSGIGKVILMILIALLGVEIVILGIINLAPESGAAVFIKDKMGFAIMFLSNTNNTGESEDPDEGDISQDGAGAPGADKAGIIAGQLYNNENIEVIEANDDLKYLVTADYTAGGINDSAPIKNNVWREDGGSVKYYDSSIIAAIIGYNSNWVNYANTGDESVLEYVKAGSPAEADILNYKKAGQIQKTFKLLQIGEIRQNDADFFVWTYEEVQDKENDNTKEFRYNYIYRVEDCGDKLLIAEYYPV